MAEQPFTRHTSVTTSRSWNVNDISSSKDGKVEKFESKTNVNGAAKTFSVEINNGVVTINGVRYDSMDAVPAADRERIERMRQGMDGDGDLKRMREKMEAMAAQTDLNDPEDWKRMLDDMKAMAAAGNADDKGEFNRMRERMETLAATGGLSAAAAEAQSARPARADPSTAPGAVPQTNTAKRMVQVLLVVAAAVVVWVLMRQFGQR